MVLVTQVTRVLPAVTTAPVVRPQRSVSRALKVDSWITGVAPANNPNSTNTPATSTIGYAGDTVGNNPVTTGLEVPQAATAPTPVKFYNAAIGTGMGNFTYTPTVKVDVPANAYNGFYTSVLTIAINSGP